MFDIATETPITFSQAAALQACRRQGKRVSTVTVWRWATRGVNGIILDTLQTPSGRITSKQALQRFFEAFDRVTTRPPQHRGLRPNPPPPVPPAPPARQRAGRARPRRPPPRAEPHQSEPTPTISRSREPRGGQAVVTLGPPTAAAIVHWLKLTVAPGTVTELRILRARNDPRFATFTVAGYFDSDHLAELAEAAMEWTGKSEGCYVSLNPVLPDLLSRAANRVITRPPRTTSDAEIVRRAGLVFDADPVRPAGVSATDIEKAAAKERIGQVLAELTRRGWPPAIMGDSGNGFHLRYRIHLPVDDGGLIETVLEAADAAFSDHRVTIDPALFNPSRIVKLFGTMSRKGDSTADRPHRRSTVLSVPTDYQVVPTALLEAFVEEFKSEVPGLNGRARPAPRPSIASERKPTGDLKPGEDFESQASWESILEPHGWTVDSRHGDEIRWTRPGKDDGPSATTGHNAGLHVFTSSAPPFEANGNYSKFAAYTLLNHGGDYQSASRDLAARGFGGQKPPTRSAGVNGKASAAATYKGAAKVAPTPFARVTCAMLIEAQPVEWLWELRVPLGVLTMFAGDPKLGKSFATLNVAAAVSRGWPLPGEDATRKPGSVLIMKPRMTQLGQSCHGSRLPARTFRGYTSWIASSCPGATPSTARLPFPPLSACRV